MVKRLQNRIAESRFTLPFVAIYAVVIWFVCGLIPEQWWIQFACFIASTYLIIELNNSNMLIRIYSKMVSSSFLALSAAACFMFNETMGIASETLMIASCLMLFKTYQDKTATGFTFYSFLAIGVASLFTPQVLLYVIPIWALMIFFLRSMSIRTFGASLIGLFLPYWILAAYFIYLGEDGQLLKHLSQISISDNIADLSMLTIPQGATLALVAALTITGSIHYFNTNYNDKIRIRMLYYCFISMSYLSLAIIILQPQWYDTAMRMLIVSTSPLIAHFIALTKTKITNIAFCFIVLVVLALTGYNLWMVL